MNLEPKNPCFSHAIGLTVTDAVNVFLRQSLMPGGVPFELTTRLPNEMLRASIEEANAMLANPNLKSYASVAEMNAAMDAEDALEGNHV